MRILILGASGFIGSATKRCLIESEKHEVLGVQRKDLDILDLQALTILISKFQPNVIFNCAAHVGSVHYVNQYAADVIMDNTLFSLNLYKSLIRSQSLGTVVVNPISNCCYPELPGLNVEGCWTNGDLHESIEGYGAYKRHLIHLSRCMYRQYKLRTINCMFPGIFGPGDSTDPNKAHALNGMISRVLKLSPDEKKFTVWGTGSPIRDWLFVDDAVAAMIRLMSYERLENPNPINITAENHVKMSTLAELILKIIGSNLTLDFDTNKQDGVMEKVLSQGVFQQYCPDFKFTPFELAVRNTVDYYKSVV